MTIRDLSLDTLHQTIQEYTTGKVDPLIFDVTNISWGFRCDGIIRTILCVYKEISIQTKSLMFWAGKPRPTANSVRQLLRKTNKTLRSNGYVCEVSAVILDDEVMTIHLESRTPVTAGVKDLVKALEVVESLHKQISKLGESRTL